MDEEEKKQLICVLCGKPWEPGYKNVCECGGSCSWGYEMGKPLSWTVMPDGSSVPNPPPAK